jgi:hypothetical protein
MADDRANDMRRVPNAAAPITWQKDMLSKDDNDLKHDAAYMYSKAGMTPDDVYEAQKENAARHAADMPYED